MIESKDTKEAKAFLQINDAMVVATADKHGEPHAATVYYVMDDDFTLYFVSDTESKKIKQLRENKKIAFTMWGGNGLFVAHGGGVAEILEGRQDEVIGRISEKLDGKQHHWPLLEIQNEGCVAVKIKPEWLTWLSIGDASHDRLREYRSII